MPEIPFTLSQTTRTAQVATAPLPVSTADVGAGAIGRGIEALGAGAESLGQSLAAIEEEKQRLRDDAALADGINSFDKFNRERQEELTRKTYVDKDEFNADRKSYFDDYDSQAELSTLGMSKEAADVFINAAKRDKDAAARRMEGIIWGKEVGFQQQKTKDFYSEKLRSLVKDPTLSLEEIQKDESLDEINELMKPFWKPGQLAALRDESLLGELKAVQRFDDARELIKSSSVFTGEERESELRQVDTAQNQVKAQDQIQFDEEKSVQVTDLMDKLLDKTLTIGDVKDISFSTANPELVIEGEELQEEWFNKLERQAAALAEDKKPPSEQTDDALYIKLNRHIEDSPDELFKDDDGKFWKVDDFIIDAMGKGEVDGISVSDGKSLINRRKSLAAEEDPVVANTRKRFQATLSGYFNAGVFGDTDDPDELDAAGATFRDLSHKIDLFYEQTPPPSNKEAEEFFKAITQKDVELGTFEKIAKFFLGEKGVPIPAKPSKASIERAELQKPAPKVGDTQLVKGVIYMLTKKGDTPAQDEWDIVNSGQ